MFNVELSIGDHGGHAVVTLCGELDLASTPAVASHLIAAVAACGPSIIVDLAGLEFIDCCGLGVLVRVLKWTRESGGEVYLAAPRHCVRRVLEIAGLIDVVFSVYPSVEQAVSASRLARPLSAAGVVAAHAVAAASPAEYGPAGAAVPSAGGVGTGRVRSGWFIGGHSRTPSGTCPCPAVGQTPMPCGSSVAPVIDAVARGRRRGLD